MVVDEDSGVLLGEWVVNGIQWRAREPRP